MFDMQNYQLLEIAADRTLVYSDSDTHSDIWVINNILHHTVDHGLTNLLPHFLLLPVICDKLL